MRSTGGVQMQQANSKRATAVLVLACALAAGCSTPPPRGFDPRDARVVPMTSAPALDINGLPGGKAVGAGAGVGAGTGSGAGVLVGAAACVATGPFFPLCVLSIVPSAAVVGAVTGGIVGAIKTESVSAIELKTKALAVELAATPYQEMLARRLKEQIDRDGLSTPASPDTRPWTLEAGIVEVGTEGKSEFALRLVGRATLREGNAAPVWQTSKEVQSETELTSAQWMADDSKALRSVLERCVEQAARQLVTDMSAVPATSRSPTPRSKYSTSCLDVRLQDVVKAS